MADVNARAALSACHVRSFSQETEWIWVGMSLRGLDSAVGMMYLQCVVTVPAPDPAPNAGKGPITYVSYYYVAKALEHGHVVPHKFYFCEVPAMWHHRVNIHAWRNCYPFTN